MKHPHRLFFPSYRLARLLGAALAVAALAHAAPASATDVAVRPLSTQQRITGFGASSAWTAGAMSDSDADLLFSPDKGAGLSLLRVRIAPDGTCGEVVTAQKAQARGATVWATPWSPAADMKSNGSLNNGSLLPSAVDMWAASLVSFVQSMQAQGVTIAYVSAQNEPNPPGMPLTYESCNYAPSELTDFIGNHLAPAFATAGLTAKIMAPETVGWNELGSYGQSALGNASASAAIGVIATHSYDGNPAIFPAAVLAKKELWETEYYDKQTRAEDPGIGSGLVVAETMHADLAYANVNAWHYWWIYPGSSDNGGLWDMPVPDAGVSKPRNPSKRLYVMGNFSRFVRPGFYRVDATTSAPNPGILTSAYYDAPSQKLVIVAINQNTTAVSQAFLFDRVATGSWSSWVTSATESLSAGAAPDPSSTPSRLVYSLEAQSVTTLQGLVTGPGPALPASMPQNGGGSNEGGGCACSIGPDERRGGGLLFATALVAAFQVRRRHRSAVRFRRARS